MKWLATLMLALVLTACGLTSEPVNDQSSGLGEVPDAGCVQRCVEVPPPLLEDGGFDPDGGFSNVCYCG